MKKSATISLSVVILMLALGLASPQTATAVTGPSAPVQKFSKTPGGKPELLPPARQANQRLETSKSVSECQNEAKDARARRSAERKTCVSIGRVTEKSTTQLSPPDLPTECSPTDGDTDGWLLFGRKYTCGTDRIYITVTEIPTGKIIGTATLIAKQRITVGTGRRADIWVQPIGWTGIGLPSSGLSTGQPSCQPTGGYCSTSGWYKWNPLDLEWYGSAWITVNLAPGSVRTIGGGWRLTFNSEKWTNPVSITEPILDSRCDTTFGDGTKVGCVFKQFTPVVGFSDTTVPEFNNHIYRAQISGLPGQLDSGTYLSRLADPALAKKNQSTACAGAATPAPAGTECDEYPFASTYEGASTGGGTTIRTFPGCGMADPQRSGNSGWSRCYINGTQNGSAGGTLGSFYFNDRVLAGEHFQVGYLP